MRSPEPMRLKARPARNATTTAAAPTHWRQRSAATARGSVGWRVPMRSSASFARRATKSSTDAPSPTTSAAARLAQARSASLHSARARSDVSIARTAVTSRAFASLIASIGDRRNCTRGAWRFRRASAVAGHDDAVVARLGRREHAFTVDDVDRSRFGPQPQRSGDRGRKSPLDAERRPAQVAHRAEAAARQCFGEMSRQATQQRRSPK